MPRLQEMSMLLNNPLHQTIIMPNIHAILKHIICLVHALQLRTFPLLSWQHPSRVTASRWSLRKSLGPPPMLCEWRAPMGPSSQRPQHPAPHRPSRVSCPTPSTRSACSLSTVWVGRASHQSQLWPRQVLSSVSLSTLTHSFTANGNDLYS